MPALPTAPNVVRLDFNQDIGTADPVGTKVFYQYSGTPPDASAITDIGAAVASNWVTFLKELMASTYSLVDVVVTDINSDLGLRGTTAVGEAGGSSSPALPQSVCVLLNHQIARRYRGGKPRSYWPWGGEVSLLNGSTLTAAYIGVVNAQWASFVAALNGQLFDSTTLVQPVSVGYYSGTFPPVTLPSGRVKQANKPLTVPHVDKITSSSCNAKLGTQRRRIRGA